MMTKHDMTPEDWGCLSSFDWADLARAHWDRLPASARRAVMRSSAAEERASLAFCEAQDAVEALGLPAIRRRVVIAPMVRKEPLALTARRP